MSKNLTRKGLAFGAIVALSSTVLAGSPAFAAGELVVAPAVGTSYTTLVTETFNLKTTFAPSFTPSSYAQLKYQVVTDGTDVNLTTGAALQTVTNVDGATVFAGGSTVADNTTVIASTGATAVSVNYLGINLDGAASTATSTNVAVTAFVDANNDGALTAGEWNASQTVSFKNFADAGAVLALTAPAEGQTTATGTLSFTSGVNTQSLTSTLNLKFDDNAATPAALAPSGAGNAGTLAFAGLATTADTAGVLKKTTGTLTAFTSTTKVGLSATLAGTAIGTRQTATATAFTIAAPTAAVVTGSNGLATGNKARLNSAFAVEATVKNTATTAVAVSGVAVTAVVSALPTLSTTKTVSINGTVYTTNASVPASIALTTDAAGKATVNFVTVGFADADNLTVAFTAGNRPTATVAVDNVVPTYTVVSSAVGSELRSIVEGGSTTFTYDVKDEFGVAIAAGSRLKFVVGYSTPVTSYAALNNGVASITVTDTTASTDIDITVAAGLQTQDTATSNWAPDTTTVNATAQTVNVTATALTFDTVPVAQSIALSTSVALTTSSVTNPGAAVTVAAKGFTFIVNSKEYVDTVTVFSGANGDVVVNAKSNTSGAQTVTFTAGTDVKTAVVTVAYPAANLGKSIDLTSVPKYSLPGATLVITGHIKDAYGNGVPAVVVGGATFSVTYAGPGFIVGGSTPTTTDATGKFTFTVITGMADSGSATVTVKFDADGATTAIAELSSVAVVTLGSAPVAGATAAIAGSTKRFFVSVDGNTSARNVVVKVAGKTFKTLKGSATKKSYVVAAPKGSHKVTVFVGGKLIATKTISVK